MLPGRPMSFWPREVNVTPGQGGQCHSIKKIIIASPRLRLVPASMQGKWACFVSQVWWKARRKGVEGAINIYNFYSHPKAQMSCVTFHFLLSKVWNQFRGIPNQMVQSNIELAKNWCRIAIPFLWHTELFYFCFWYFTLLGFRPSPFNV